MEKHLIVKKGYTIHVVSWQGRLDYIQENTLVVETEEEVNFWITIFDFLIIEKIENITYSLFTNDLIYKVINFAEQYAPKFLPENYQTMNGFDIVEYFFSMLELLGGSEGSEYYYLRKIGYVTITYNPEDIYVEEIYSYKTR